MVVFEELVLVYDQSINWSQRLDRELPLLKELVKHHEHARILDLACGSGHHAVALAAEGHEVIGVDLSPQMIQTATHHAQEKGVTVQFHSADMMFAKKTVEGSFDLIICLGNSLALLPSIKAMETTFQGAQSLLKQEGFFVTQTLNFEEMRRSKFRFFPLKSGITAAGTEVIFARFFERISGTQTATMVFTGFVKTNNDWNTTIRKQQILQLSRQNIEQTLLATGFKHTEFYSNYHKHPFSPTESRNLITITQK